MWPQKNVCTSIVPPIDLSANVDTALFFSTTDKQGLSLQTPANNLKSTSTHVCGVGCWCLSLTWIILEQGTNLPVSMRLRQGALLLVFKGFIDVWYPLYFLLCPTVSNQAEKTQNLSKIGGFNFFFLRPQAGLTNQDHVQHYDTQVPLLPASGPAFQSRHPLGSNFNLYIMDLNHRMYQGCTFIHTNIIYNVYKLYVQGLFVIQ